MFFCGLMFSLLLYTYRGVELLSHVVLFIILRNCQTASQSVPFSLSTEVYEVECITFIIRKVVISILEKGNKNILTVPLQFKICQWKQRWNSKNLAISATRMEEYSTRYGYENDWVRLDVRYFSDAHILQYLLHYCVLFNNDNKCLFNLELLEICICVQSLKNIVFNR